MNNENILCTRLNEMKARFDLAKQLWAVSKHQIDDIPVEFVCRDKAESDFSIKQLIPYAIVTDGNGDILCYQRAGSEQRLAGIWSAGIGGHVNDKDEGNTVFETLVNGLKREFQEEIGISPTNNRVTLVGMINEEETEVGHCHTGIVFAVQVNRALLSFDSEISNPTWFELEELQFDKFELWSALAIELYKNIIK